MNRSRRAWPRRVAVGAVVWFVVYAGALLLGLDPQPALLAALVASAALVVVLYGDASASTASNRWALEDVAPTRRPGEDTRLVMLTRLIGSHLDSHQRQTQLGSQLHDQLVQLLDRRLVARHGVSLRADPERALELMGPELAVLVQQPPPYPRMNIEQIDVLVSRIEEL